jgi:dienelactone hydrolase
VRFSLLHHRLLALLALCLLATACDEPKTVQIPLGSENLSGLYWEPSKRLSPAVVLLPMLGGSKEDWTPLATLLHKEGYGVLALDLREQGRTDREHLVADARTGFDFRRAQKKVDAARIGLVGASIGANAALNFAAEEPLVRTTVLLSPGLNYRGVVTEPALRDYGVRPLLLMASEEDLSSAGAVRTLADASQSDAVVKFYPGSAHGTDLLQVGLPVAADILAFLQAHL